MYLYTFDILVQLHKKLICFRLINIEISNTFHEIVES